MKAVLKGIGFVVVLAIVGVLLVAATRPDTFTIQRSAIIQAAPETIFPYFNEFQRWPAWSPYEHKDPAMKRSYSGPASGVGAVYAWHGNADIGVGSMEITEASAPRRLALNLDFVEPMEAHNRVEFTLTPKGEATEVTWTMTGESSYPAKIAQVFFDMDAMVGADMETGLASLKAVTER